jgi:hypothetical protein
MSKEHASNNSAFLGGHDTETDDLLNSLSDALEQNDHRFDNAVDGYRDTPKNDKPNSEQIKQVDTQSSPHDEINIMEMVNLIAGDDNQTTDDVSHSSRSNSTHNEQIPEEKSQWLDFESHQPPLETDNQSHDLSEEVTPYHYNQSAMSITPNEIPEPIFPEPEKTSVTTNTPKVKKTKFNWWRKRKNENTTSFADDNSATQQVSPNSNDSSEHTDTVPTSETDLDTNTTRTAARKNTESENGNTRNPQITAFHKATFALSILSILVGATLGVFVLRNIHGSSDEVTNQIITNLRQEMVARMDKMESKSLSSTTEFSSANADMNIKIQQLDATTRDLSAQLASVKQLTDKISTDTEFSMNWSKQTRSMADELKSSFEILSTSMSDVREDVAKVKSATAKISSQRIAAEKIAEKAQKENTPVTELAGYKLFDIDDWGGVLLLTMIQGDKIQRLQIGDPFEGWRVESADLQGRKAIFVKGSQRTTVLRNGG